jgi:hypothetical protein
MKNAAIKTVGRAAVERLGGHQPGRGRAVAAALVTGAATAVLTYQALRSGSD